MDLLLDVLIDSVLDALKLIPFLFIAFLIIEYLEHKLTNKNKKIISSSGKCGPFFGAVLGVFPQCGFSVMATNLYVTRIITLGTLIAVYLSTSDEMLPILISENIGFDIIFKIILIKIILGMIYGFIIDFILRKKNKYSQIDCKICDEEHCHCDNGGIFFSSIKHTLNTILFIFVITLLLNLFMAYIGESFLMKLFFKNSIFGSFITSLIGLIPNCASSIVITELYLNNAINFGALLGGLLTGSGVGLLVLFKSNHDIKENIKILLLMYFIGSISGVLIELVIKILS